MFSVLMRIIVQLLEAEAEAEAVVGAYAVFDRWQAASDDRQAPFIVVVRLVIRKHNGRRFCSGRGSRLSETEGRVQSIDMSRDVTVF